VAAGLLRLLAVTTPCCCCQSLLTHKKVYCKLGGHLLLMLRLKLSLLHAVLHPLHTRPVVNASGSTCCCAMRIMHRLGWDG
jgi:hypothetical protein